MKIKFDRSSWYIKMLGEPDHWCQLLWGVTWRAVMAILLAIGAYWYLHLMVLGNWEVLKGIMNGDYEAHEGYVAGGMIMDFLTLYVAGGVAWVYRTSIRKWVNANCSKVEYETDETET